MSIGVTFIILRHLVIKNSRSVYIRTTLESGLDLFRLVRWSNDMIVADRG
jgi:hypothetical protein